MYLPFPFWTVSQSLFVGGKKLDSISYKYFMNEMFLLKLLKFTQAGSCNALTVN